MTKIKPAINSLYFFQDRDLSWLSFNDRVLREAERESVPLMERIRFLAISSSNMDEFFRVRMPALMALKRLASEKKSKTIDSLLAKINDKVHLQQERFGSIIQDQLVHALKLHGIFLFYNEPIPQEITPLLKEYFIHFVATYIHIVNLSDDSPFFPENNKLYLVVTVRDKNADQFFIVNIPSDKLSRFISINHGGVQYVIFLDDIVRTNLPMIFPGSEIIDSHSFKITRSAELDLEDEFTGNLSKKIEKKLRVRDFGLATRFLFEPGLHDATLKILKHKFSLEGANLIPGGRYHNLKNLLDFPLKDSVFQYDRWTNIEFKIESDSLFNQITKSDILLHTPYHDYNAVVRFFNEAAIDITVKTIYVTLYRIANDSRIANALISAAKNGKRVVVFVELKARFDEANNIKWAKRMKAAGVQIIESIPGLKVHAKIALVKRKVHGKVMLLGLLATGNFNENTAKYYTDHVLMTSQKQMLREVERLFVFLRKRKKHPAENTLHFKHLLVGQFNLQSRFLTLIDREIYNVKKGLPASIIIKLNNIEEKILIAKLYEAAQAGVKITLIVRSICCLIPGVTGMSENIFAKRIVDRYLEHGRIFIFNNNNNPEIFLGSADWMNRNIYRRIEVCFPLYESELKSQILKIINLQIQDNTQAVGLDQHCENVEIKNNRQSGLVRSQQVIGDMLAANGNVVEN
ncbi:MAG TPA: polyphosphate kinase 1 [Chryseolinea sp.]|nr:polyphosphate kinase 1 [Chryseolinea sp.]